MSLQKIYICHHIPEKGLSLLHGKVDFKFWDGEGPVPEDVLFKEISDADGVITMLTEKVDSHFFDAAPNVKVVSNYAVGYNNIDVTEATRRNVRVTNTPGVLTDATADVAFGLLLAAARRFSESERFLRAGDWKCWHPKMLLGKEISGATLGIVGMGMIGQAVAKRAAGFSMNVIYTSRSRKKDLESQLGIKWVSMDELLCNSDFVSLHCPLTEETQGLIGSDEFKKMKTDSVIVNTSRGPVIDQSALYYALRDGVIGAAGLDVYRDEPISMEDPLLKLKNLVMLPHIGSATVDARDKMAIMAVSNVLSVLDSKEPSNPVN